jgi:hypothetical protein
MHATRPARRAVHWANREFAQLESLLEVLCHLYTLVTYLRMRAILLHSDGSKPTHFSAILNSTLIRVTCGIN